LELNNFVLRLIILALPGIITLYILRFLKGPNANKKDWENIFELLVLSLVCYLLFYCCVMVSNLIKGTNDEVVFINALFDEKIRIYWPEIIWVSLIGVCVAFFLSFVDTYKLINKFGRLIKVTKRYGDEDVWEFVHNLPEAEWVYVRDHKLDLIYYGFVQLYSDTEKERELLINDVDVYRNSDGEFIYSTKSIYICRDKYDLTIEIPNNKNLEVQK